MDYADNDQLTVERLRIAYWLRKRGKYVRPKLTQTQKVELRECFDLIDSDGSGAIDATELITAFKVLGFRVKKSEVEKMLAEVDSDGSGEVEYPEFEQIMTTKLDQQQRNNDNKNAQTLPFQLLATAYRRKKLMDAVMAGDKATRERLMAKADAAEAERAALSAENADQKWKRQNRPWIERMKDAQKKLKKLTLAEVFAKRMKNFTDGAIDPETGLPVFIAEAMDADMKDVFIRYLRREKGSERDLPDSLANLLVRNSVRRGSTAGVGGGYVRPQSRYKTIRAPKLLEGLNWLQKHPKEASNKPVLERQLMHLKAVQSIHQLLDSRQGRPTLNTSRT
ncbi:hypothetical protein CBR_g38208 [Chara braunii]|uniref:EF-hand domain-containing protein n=1 Tax=Chara braunii TaxID=69332 RepID=A0A388LPH9_CHABU|nr:hypothetical protein CBR_g38208 [Chara braunii]|eukprot:GBG84237.1 hypothetical protein CBR_g38208 [Chara braunii]